MHKHQRPKGTGPLTIPDEAVEAAAKAYYAPTPRGESRMRRALEAAAPHMLLELMRAREGKA